MPFVCECACHKWIHRRCAGVTRHNFEKFSKSDYPWYCPCCTVEITKQANWHTQYNPLGLNLLKLINILPIKLYSYKISWKKSRKIAVGDEDKLESITCSTITSASSRNKGSSNWCDKRIKPHEIVGSYSRPRRKSLNQVTGNQFRSRQAGSLSNVLNPCIEALENPVSHRSYRSHNELKILVSSCFVNSHLVNFPLCQFPFHQFPFGPRWQSGNWELHTSKKNVILSRKVHEYISIYISSAQVNLLYKLDKLYVTPTMYQSIVFSTMCA